MKTQDQLLTDMLENTHVLFSPEFIENVNSAFKVKIDCRSYHADGNVNPKGLTTHDGTKFAIGLACFDLAPMLCNALNVEFVGCLGRGFQVRACIAALQSAGYGA